VFPEFWYCVFWRCFLLGGSTGGGEVGGGMSGGEECRESAAGRQGEHSGSYRGSRGGNSDKDGHAGEGQDGDV